MRLFKKAKEEPVTTTAIATEEPDEYSGTGYCVKCKAKRAFSGAITERTSASSTRTTRMARGTCPVCSTTISRILGKAS